MIHSRSIFFLSMLLASVSGPWSQPVYAADHRDSAEDITTSPCPADAGFMMLWRSDWMQRVRAEMDAGGMTRSPALEALLCNADKALERGPFSVAHKTPFPENRDIHDYYSLAPYWWPDPDSPDGLPYLRRDGQTNPERYGDGVDGKRRHDMTQDVTALTLAGFFTRERRYLDHAAEQIRVWFIDPETAMNPHMEHAQYIPGRSTGRSFGIIDSRAFVRIIDAAALLHESQALSDREMVKLRAWFGHFAEWLKDSTHGQQERAAENNHGSFYDLQLAAFSRFAGHDHAATQVVRGFIEQRLRNQIDESGRMPHELARTRPFHYTLFNLQAILNMALLADRIGIDLLELDRQGADRIRAAISFVAGEGKSAHDWPLDRTHENYAPLYDALRLYDALSGNNHFDDLARQSGSAFESSLTHLLLPPKAIGDLATH